MEFTLLSVYNVTVMFIMICVGYAIFRLGLLNYDGAKQLSLVLTNVIMPCVVLNSFQLDFEKSLAFKLLITALISFIMHVLGIALSKIAFKHLPYSAQSIYRYGSIMPNCGFITLPIVYAMLGDIGVLYVSVHIAVTSIFVWTYGIYLLTNDRTSLSLKKAVFNPGVISVIVAIPLFIFSIKIPPIILDPMKSLASVNGPIAMIATGVFIAQTDIISSIKDKYIYWATALRQIIVPSAVGAFMLLIMHLGWPMDNNMFLASMLASAAPIAINASLFAARCDADVGLASQAIAISTLLYTVTITIMIYLSTLALGM